MPLSMHRASAPVFVLQLKALSVLLQKGADFAEAKGVDPATLIEARLTPDMFPLSRQVQIATDMAKGGMARLAGQEAPSWPDEEKTFPELQARIAKAVAYIESFPADQIDGSETRSVLLKAGPETLTFDGQTYLLHFVLPNLFFHATMTYALLRQAGVEVGKRDFLGGL